MSDPAQHDSTRPGHAMRDLPRWHPNPHIRRTIDVIRRNGWQVTSVGDSAHGESSDPIAPECPFAYTSGLTLADIPELAVYGLDRLSSTRLLCDVARLLHRHDWREIVDGRVPVTVESWDSPVRLIELIDKDDLVMANLLFPDSPALQVMWADDYGLLPWEAGYSLLPMHQPVKGFPDLAARRLPPRPRIITGDRAREAG